MSHSPHQISLIHNGISPIETIIEGHQQYTLKVKPGPRSRETLCTHRGVAILTTDYAALVLYATQLITLFPENVYTISLITTVQVFK